jgi:hypothetical protein
MPESVGGVRASLKAYFSDKFQASEHFETYVRIGSYLSDASQFHGGLLILEGRLAAILNDRLAAIRDVLRTTLREDFQLPALLALLRGIREGRHLAHPNVRTPLIPFVPYAKYLYRKLLTVALYEWEVRNGFTHDPSGKVDILFGNPGRLFNEQLKAGRPFKDVGAGREHGEFAHRIQWFLAGAGLQLPNPGLLFRDVARWITLQAHPSISGYGPAVKRYLWEFLFDRDGIPSNATGVHFRCVDECDFRAPSNLTRRLIEETRTYPTLAWCLRDRFRKREVEALDMGYVARKAPDHPEGQQVGEMAGRLRTGQFDPESDLALHNRVLAGLFIRRGGQVTDIDWQAQ